MKFLGDMSISPRTIALLREQGYDAIHLIEENLEKMTDQNILD
jgi:predicted nuclease of predicted toxin-antitoxin system